MKRASEIPNRCRYCLSKATGADMRCTRCRMRDGQLKRFKFTTPERQVKALTEGLGDYPKVSDAEGRVVRARAIPSPSVSAKDTA